GPTRISFAALLPLSTLRRSGVHSWHTMVEVLRDRHAGREIHGVASAGDELRRTRGGHDTSPHRQRYFCRRCRTIRKLRSTTSISSASSYCSFQGASVPPHCGHGAASSARVCTTSTRGSAACSRGPWPRRGTGALGASSRVPPPRRS